MEIIIRNKNSFGKIRSEQEQNIRKEWGATVTDEQLDKIKFIEKKIKEFNGSNTNFIGTIETEKVQ
jgi:uncharacterized membrane protein YcgQ (UPF0703/DUF1980 family)